MRAGQLSNPAFVKLLRPFIVTSWHGIAETDMPADVKEIFDSADIPKRSNVFMFVLDQRGRLVQGFNALRGGPRGKEGVSSPQQEITSALSKLNLPDNLANRTQEHPLVLPDLSPANSTVPSGVRMFVRPTDQRGKRLVIEVVAMKPDEWKVLEYPEQTTRIQPEDLQKWLVQMYPPAIRTADQKKPFAKITGSLRLEPAGADEQHRYALLSGEVRLAKGDENESAFEGTLQAVVTYRIVAPSVESVQGVLEGDYLYRVRGTQRIPLISVIESRPDSQSRQK